jgi:hypothetical protein
MKKKEPVRSIVELLCLLGFWARWLWAVAGGEQKESPTGSLQFGDCETTGFDASLVLSRVQCPAMDCSSPLLQELLDVTWYNMTCDA